MTTYQPLFGALTSQITQLHLAVVQDLTRHDRYTIDEYIKVLEADPLAYRCIEIKSLRAQNAFGKYTHGNKDIEEFINRQFDDMQGTLRKLVGQLSSAMPLGFAVAEIIFDNWNITGFNILDPRRIRFRGSKGNIDEVVYKDGQKEIYIPYWKVIHVINGDVLSFNDKKAYGEAECKKALAYIKLKQAMFADMGVSAKTLATGILFGQADSQQSVQGYDATGRPIGKPKSAVDALSEQLGQLENHSHIVTDKSNMVTALNVPAGEQFWNLGQMLVKTEILRAFGINDLIFSEGSAVLPTATLGELHFSVLDATIKNVIDQIRDQLIEKVIKTLVTWHYGKQNSYGSFELEVQQDPSQKAMRFNNMITAISTQVLDPSDPEVINAIRKDLGLSIKDNQQIEWDNALKEQQQQQMMQQQPYDGAGGVETADNMQQYP